MLVNEKIINKFLDRISPEPNSGCWLWTTAFNYNGYGRFCVHNYKQVKAHRFSYVLFKGPIPDGLVIDHLCMVKACVNPNHLEAVTRFENNRREVLAHGHYNSKKTHCINGHPYTPENTLKQSRGGRACKICMTAYRKEWQKKHGS